jgi:hypothetical protein
VEAVIVATTSTELSAAWRFDRGVNLGEDKLNLAGTTGLSFKGLSANRKLKTYTSLDGD